MLSSFLHILLTGYSNGIIILMNFRENSLLIYLNFCIIILIRCLSSSIYIEPGEKLYEIKINAI
jgi:hypothetical protein